MSTNQSTVWGKEEVRVSLFSIQALKLKWCLRDLQTVKGRVLDLGCGGGGLTRAIKFYRPDLEVIGYDSNKQAVNIAKKNNGGVKFMRGDAYKLPFKNNSFAAVVSFDFLEHLKQPEKVIVEAYRVLKPNGLFHNFIPLEAQPWTFYALLPGWQGKKITAGHQIKYSANIIKTLLNKSGFKVKTAIFGHHWLLQVFDIIYILFWQILKIKPLDKKGLSGLKNIFSPLFNLESLVFQKMPGGGISIGAIKK